MKNKSMDRSSKTIEHRAGKGDIKALHEIASRYEHGRYVDADIDLSTAYYKKLAELTYGQSISIKSLRLINFRMFHDLKIVFENNTKDNSNLTVLIGNNGTGKTTVMEAVEKSLSWLYRNVIKKDVNGESIGFDDIRRSQNVDYASIITEFNITDGTSFDIELCKSTKGFKGTKKSQYADIKLLADILRVSNSGITEYNLPIMTFYSVKRSTDIPKSDLKNLDNKKLHKQKKFDAYENTLNGRADFDLFFNWYEALDTLSLYADKKNQAVQSEISELEAELASDLLQVMQKQAETDESVKKYLDKFRLDKQDAINRLKKQLEGNIAQRQIDIVTKAIEAFMPEFHSLRIERSENNENSSGMLINKGDIALSVSQLSQGEKSLLAMVADIARRLILLNPSLENPLEGRGVVLIDEIDLHLHPAWQQTVIVNLLETFPNIQFIISTHSPQVLSTVPAQCIRILSTEFSFNELSIAETPSKQTRGVASSVLMAEIQGVDPVPDVVESKSLSEYKALIVQGEHKKDNGLNLKKKLDSHFGSDHPVMKECERLIRISSMQVKLLKGKGKDA